MLKDEVCRLMMNLNTFSSNLMELTSTFSLMKVYMYPKLLNILKSYEIPLFIRVSGDLLCYDGKHPFTYI